jgi:hypothetical protein
MPAQLEPTFPFRRYEVKELLNPWCKVKLN